VHVEHEPRLHRKAPGRTPAVRPRR
jgi:hypothetical protein